jgi:PAS domain S-box-containing protein
MRKTGRATSRNVTPHAWVRMDAAGLIRFVSRQAELLFGYDGDDMGGQPIETLIPEPVCKIYDEPHPVRHLVDVRYQTWN